MARPALTLIVALALPLSAAAPAASLVADVSGECLLSGATDHSGSLVKFEAVSPSAQTDSTGTAIDGSYQISLVEGIYSVHFSHPGYTSHTLPEDQTFGPGPTVLPPVTLLGGNFLEISGPVEGVWTSDVEYRVVETVAVRAGKSLRIEAGTVVNFLGPYKLDVAGQLLVEGTEADSVFLVCGLPEPATWWGVRFRNDAQPASAIRFASIRRGGRGIHFEPISATSSITVEDCLISESTTEGLVIGGHCAPAIRGNTISFNAGGGITCDGPAEIHGNRIEDNGGVAIAARADIVISSNELRRNARGIECRGWTPTIVDNRLGHGGVELEDTLGGVIAGNSMIGDDWTHGIYLYRSSPLVVHNTIALRGTGIHTAGGTARIEHNVVTTWSDGMMISTAGPTIQFNDVWKENPLYPGVPFTGEGLPPGIGELVTLNAVGDSCDTYFNVSLDPRFAVPGEPELAADSPCIDAGNPDSLDADGTIADLGAVPFPQSTPAAPAVSFVTNDGGVATPVVQFRVVNAGGPITGWSWDFGDGDGSDRHHPLHVYDGPGRYAVSLTAVGPGGSDTETRTVSVRERSGGMAPEDAPAAAPSTPTATAPRAFGFGGLGPNPFRGSIAVPLALPRREAVSLRVFDVRGRLRRTLLDQTLGPGRIRPVWDGRDDAGRPVAAGVYFLRASAGETRASARVVVLR